MFCNCNGAANNPEESNRDNLKQVGDKPFVGETPQDALNSWLTPNPLFYVRSHFDYPNISKSDGAAWTVTVDGGLGESSSLSILDLKKLPSKTISMIITKAVSHPFQLMIGRPSIGYNLDLIVIGCCYYQYCY